MSHIAFIFPGQASQYPGMGKELFEKYEPAREVFEEADRVLGFSLSQLCFEGPEDELKLTQNTQPAILAVSVAAYGVLAANGIQPDYVAGHSLGEYSALVATGALGLPEALTLVRNRGRYMQEAVPIGQGAMAAILGLDEEVLIGICAEAAQGEIVSPANFNSPQQTVIAGSAGAVQRAMKLAKDRGAKRAAPLPVSAPFHCALMRPAEIQLQQDIARLCFSEPAFPLVNNVDAVEVATSARIGDSLVRQVCSPVRWTESMQFLIRRGVEFFVEVGPGRILSGLLRQIDRNLKLANVENEKSLNETLTFLSKTE